jgi:diaminopimelate decarboxylase
MTTSLEARVVGTAEYAEDAAYILDLPRFVTNLNDFAAAFRAHYPRSRTAYSVKTNYMPVVCRSALAAGCLLEVVSEMEYDLAIRLKTPPQSIIVNGPCKPQAFLERSLLAGALVNLDGLPDLNVLTRVARSQRQTSFRVGLRCNLPIAGESRSRFGFDATNSSELLQIAGMVRSLPNVRLAGIHCHYNFANRSANNYGRLTIGMLILAKLLFPDSPPEFINVGGGFLSPMPPQLSRQFGSNLPDYHAYGAAIASEFARAFGLDGNTYLLAEPGIAIVADAMSFETRVVDVRRVGNREFVLVAGSVYNVKPTKSRRNLPLRIVPAGDAKASTTRSSVTNAEIVGYTCMEDDVLHVGFDGSVGPSDVAIFDNVGAYSLVLKPPFIEPCPPVYVSSAAGNTLALAKRGETLDDIFATYVFPESGIEPAPANTFTTAETKCMDEDASKRPPSSPRIAARA